MEVRICIIGAGSAIFSLNLIRDIALCEGLARSTVALMDVDEERLDSIYRLCQRFSAESGTHLKVERTTDRREALRGADFVVHVALDGGHDRLRQGWDVAYKNGYRFGGSLHIVHDEAFWVNFYQLRLMESVLRDTLELAPNAYFVLVANPVMAGVAQLTRKYPQARVVGMCHGSNKVNYLAHHLGLDPKQITWELPGVNHFIWLTKFYYQGKNAFPLLDKWIAEQSEEFFKTCSLSNRHGRKAIDLYKRFGAFPIGDTSTPGGGSWGWWYHTDEARWGEDPRKWYADYFIRAQKQVQSIFDAAHDETVRAMDVFSSVPSGEPMIPLIEGIACDTERKVVVNIPNKGGLMPGVPEDFEVEVQAVCSRKGIQGIRNDGLPPELLNHLLRDRVIPVETELLAYETGRRETLLSLLLMDPWTHSREQAERLLADIFSMPCCREMNEHYL